MPRGGQLGIVEEDTAVMAAIERGVAVTRQRRRKDQQGFTMIELLIVVIVIAILAAIAIPTYLGQRQKAKDAAVKEAVHSLQVGVQTYAVDHGDAYPASGDLAVLKDGYVDAWPHDPYRGGTMAYASSPTAGSYAYTSTGTSYEVIGWLSNGSFEVPGGRAAASVFQVKTDYLIQLELAYYAKYGRWPRSWAPYCYTDLGLNPSDYASSLEGVFYKVGGSKVSVRPDVGYQMTVTDATGKARVMTNNLSWDIVYDATSGKWYFHTITPSNEVDMSTMSIAKV
jgi:prepilin-type N-terminal cleavage/methylation domain-containing protein